MKRLNLFFGSVGFTGLFPIAPATFTTFVLGLLLWLWGPGPVPLLVFFLIGLFVSVPISTRLERDYGKDPKLCTIDELAGYLLALQGRDLSGPDAWQPLVAAFFLFRFFDILKIWPGRRLEGLPEGWGIVADDIMAGAYSFIVLAALLPWTA